MHLFAQELYQDNDDPREFTALQNGEIARLTGINPATIRMWQTRYDAVEPVRTEGKQRLYIEKDLAKLSLLKELTDHGDSYWHDCQSLD